MCYYQRITSNKRTEIVVVKKYEWVLFDADETLLRFDSSGALKNMFTHFNVTLTTKDFDDYEILNKSLWTAYQNGQLSAQALQIQRFANWGKKLNIDPMTLNDAFLEEVTKISAPLDGATQLLNAINGKIKLGIITNGFVQSFYVRMERAALKHHFDFFIISEEVGLAKPHPGIFDHAFERMGNPARENVLMVGDSLESDILGGKNAGIDTCWLNPYKKIAPDHITPHLEIASLTDLENLLLPTLNNNKPDDSSK
jgi:5'-nucleotidase